MPLVGNCKRLSSISWASTMVTVRQAHVRVPRPAGIGTSGLPADPDRTAVEVVAPDAGRALQPAGPGGYGLAAPSEHPRRQEVRGPARGVPELPGPGRVRHAEGEQPGDLEGAQVDDA